MGEMVMAKSFPLQLPPDLLTACWPGERGVMGLRVCKTLREQLSHGRVCLIKNHLSAVNKDKLRKDLDRLRGFQLSVTWTYCDAGVLLDVLADSESVGGLQSLTLRDGVVARSENEPKLANVLSRSHALRHLDLSHNSFGYGAARILVGGLGTCRSLTSLNCISCNLGNEEMAGIAGSGWQCSGLVQLHLQYNSIGDEGASKLAEALVECKALTDLDLTYNRVKAEGAGRLAEVLRECKGLGRVGVGRNLIGDEGVEKLSASLAGSSNLFRLDLDGNGIRGIGVRALKGCNALSDLDMSKNDIGDEGATALAEILRDCRKTVAHLRLVGCGIRDVGATQLSQALAGCAELRQLVLYSNSIGDGGASQLADALARSTALKHLCLSYNEIGDEGAGQVVDSLVSCKSLELLDLMEQIRRDGRLICSRRTSISGDGVRRLRDETGVIVR